MSDDSSEESSPNHSAHSPESSNQTKKDPMTVEPKRKSGNPKTTAMVDEAIKELSSQRTMSLKAIKRSVIAKYGPISETQSKNINKYVNKAINEGYLVQPKGKKGITATFKAPSAAVLAALHQAAKVAKAVKSAASEKSSKVTSSTKLTSPSKKQVSSKTASKPSTADQKRTTTKTKSATDKAPKSKMAKKMTKSPTTKPKKVTGASKSPKLAAKK